MVWAVSILIFLLIVSAVTFIAVNFNNESIRIKTFVKDYLFFVFLLFIPSVTGFLLKFSGVTILMVFFQVYCLAIGYWYLRFYKKNYFKKLYQPEFSRYLFACMIACLSAIAFIFCFNFFSELQGSIRKIRTVGGLFRTMKFYADLMVGGPMSGSLILFIVPLLIDDTFSRYLEIPSAVYKKWIYPRQPIGRDLDAINPEKLNVIELEVAKNPGDKHASSFQIKAPMDLEFGFIFFKFINDYNYKFPETPFDHSGTEENPTGWLFYKKPNLLGIKTFIDPDLTLTNNKVKEYKVIVAKRVLLEN